MSVEHLLTSIPPILVYLLVGGVVLIESMGVPLPGETALVAAAILSSRHELAVSPLLVALAGATGAIIGDSIGYAVGHHFGNRLLAWARRRFPKHFGAKEIAFTESVFARYGMAAVFFGRFVALLRIFAGPISGVLRMPYHRFLPANALGGLGWSFGTTYLVYSLGTAAEKWLKTGAWIGLGVFLLASLLVSTVLSRRVRRAVEEHAQRHPDRVEAVEAMG